MNTFTDETHSSKVMSALSAITTMASSLLPNAIDLQQLNQLISNLIQMPSSTVFISGNDSTSNVTNVSIRDDNRLQMRREKHRQTERVRHNTIIEMIRQLSQLIGITDRQESQANILNRSARYVLFLTYVIDRLEVDINDDSIDILSEEWLQSLYPLYERSLEEATNLIQNCYEEENNFITESSKGSTDPHNLSLDHCISYV